jgi:hypothetical protein
MADAMTSDSASRVTRSRRSLWRALLLTAAVMAGVTVLRAQEAAPAAPPATAPRPAASAPPAGAPDDAAVPGDGGRGDEARKPADVEAKPPSTAAPDGADASAPSAAKPDGKVGPTRDRFEPTEKVRADFDVSFPVDI